MPNSSILSPLYLAGELQVRIIMNGSESFGVGERFYHSLCPVTLSTDTTLTCPQCHMITYRSGSIILYEDYNCIIVYNVYIV